MNREKAFRKSVYDALQNIQITVDGSIVDVPVYDQKLESDDLIYIIIDSQSAVWIGDFVARKWNCSVDIEIKHKQQDSAVFDIVDDVGEEIENRLITTVPALTGIIAQPGWRMMNNVISSVSNLKLQETQSSGFVSSKLIVFSSQLIKS